jgi:AcrR family transcriptional regulator
VEKNRNLARTRERILKAALAKFAAHGLAGTRCEDIARRARVNKRMLFYCFGSKQELYREILRRKFSQRATLYESVPSDLGSAILHWYEAFSSDLEWVRLLEWEALGNGRGELVGEQADVGQLGARTERRPSAEEPGSHATSDFDYRANRVPARLSTDDPPRQWTGADRSSLSAQAAPIPAMAGRTSIVRRCRTNFSTCCTNENRVT